ncbi:hypothetical protein ACGFYQ_34030 [Streptomyces sp. NPDC048258]|uniref:hypothetical protein n=1 Tax=Streptomyces sp. NPDC048258 TaxID=3365527 RepID=UPI0037194864
MTPGTATASNGIKSSPAAFRRWLLASAVIPAVIVIGCPLWRAIFGSRHEYHFPLWFTSSDFLVSGLIIAIAGNIELQSARLSGIHTSSKSVKVAAGSLVVATLGLTAYGWRYQAEEEAIRSRVALDVDLTLMIACPVIFLAMLICGVMAAAQVLNSRPSE